MWDHNSSEKVLVKARTFFVEQAFGEKPVLSAVEGSPCGTTFKKIEIGSWLSAEVLFGIYYGNYRFT